MEETFNISKALQTAADKVANLETSTFDTYVTAYKALGALLTPISESGHSQRKISEALGVSTRKVNWSLAVDKAVRGRKSFDKIVSTYKAANAEPTFVAFLEDSGIITKSAPPKVDVVDVECKRISKLTKAQRRKLFARLQDEFAGDFTSK